MNKPSPPLLWISILAVIALMITAFAIGRLTAPSAPEGAPDQEPEQVAESDEPEPEQATTYYCSMHPEQTSDDPDATCPICGMDLIPGDPDDADDDEDLPILRVSERAMRLMDIQTQPAERRPARTEVSFVGNVDFNEQRLADVVARSDSYIERLHANYRWMPVERGQVLAEVYSPAATAAAQELLTIARHRGGDNPAALEAGKAKLRRLGVSLDQIERVLETGEVPPTFELRSPIDGVVVELPAREGDWLRDGARLLRITDLSTLWLHLEAYERDLQWLHPGQNAQFTVQSLPGHHFDGEVTFIDPAVDQRKRTARVRIEVPNPEGRLKPGMFARGRIEAAVSAQGEPLGAHPEDEQHYVEDDKPLLIPATAPLITGRRAVVYIRDLEAERPTFEGRPVELGPRVGDHYVVLSGLEEGDRVVTQGAFKIDSELQIRGRPSMMGRRELFQEMVDEPRVDPDHPAHAIAPGDIPEDFADTAVEALKAYFDLAAALADDDIDAAKDAVKLYHDLLIELDDKSLDEPGATAWQELTPQLHDPLHKMFPAESLEEIRAELEQLSHYTELMIAAFIGNRAGPVYRLHCPMAFDNEGADWLQPDDEVRNPYFGPGGHYRCADEPEPITEAAKEEEEEEDDDDDEQEEEVVEDEPDDTFEAELADYPLDTCVVTDLDLDAMGGPVRHEHEGHTVFFCCDGCLPQFEDDPEKYLDKIEQAEQEHDH